MSILKKIFKGIFYCFADIHKYNWVYKIVALIGLILRVGLLPFLIPNVFELIAGIFICKLNFAPWIYEIIIRLILLVIDAIALSNIFYWLTFLSVGNFYESQTSPVFGSVCYTILYFIHLLIPMLLIQYFNWLTIILIFAIYIIVVMVLYIFANKFDTIPNNWILRLIIFIFVYALILTGVIMLKIFVF